MKYLGHRILQSLFLLFGVSLLSFAFVELAPGSFYDEIRLNPQISSETLANLQRQYGMGQSLPVRYLCWLKSGVKGEFGFSFAYNSPVAPLLWSRACNTLLLTVSATLLAWLVALPLGILSAQKRRGWIDRFGGLLISMLLATPDVLLALGMLLFALRIHWLPVGGMLSVETLGHAKWEKLTSIGIHLLGPVVVLVLVSLPTLTRHVRSAMSEALDSPYIHAARAHGIPRWRIVLGHALPVAANPLISLFGLSLGSLLSASLLTEVVMSWPGLGPLLLEAILGRDLYVVIGAVMCASLFFVCGTLIGDLLLFAADPRIRVERMP
ncbi:MAG: ABC transporter permease [Candidatus Sulfotelmatobacter sp.]